MRKIFLCFCLCVLLSGGMLAPGGVYGFNHPRGEAALNGAALIPEADEAVKLPVIMYHLVTKQGAQVGRYGITPEALESDLKYLRDNGYGTVVMKDVHDFVVSGGALPDKPVMLTFDDGNSGDYQYLYPLLKQYQMKAVVSVVGKFTDDSTALAEKNPAGGFPNMTWPQIREMAASGVAEIQSHSYNLHTVPIGAGKRGGESVGAYQARLTADLTRLHTLCEKEANTRLNTFTYPLGVIGEGSEAVLKDMGYIGSFSCTEGISIVKRGEPQGLFLLKRCIRPSGKGIGAILERYT